MTLYGLTEINENRPAGLARVYLPHRRAVDVLNSGGVVRAQVVPESIKCGAGVASGLIGAGGREGVELERPDVGAPPFLLTRAGPGERLKPGERLTAAVDQPGRFVAAS